MNKTAGKLICLFNTFGLTLGLCFSSSTTAIPLNLATVPLVTAGAVDPNAMLLFDTSASMHNIVPDAPYIEGNNYFECDEISQISPNDELRVDIRVYINGSVKFRHDGEVYTWGNTSDDETKCFISNQNYYARLYGDNYSENSGGNYRPGVYLPSVYTGNYLNWYFSNSDQSGPDNFGAYARKKPGTVRRMDIAQNAASNLMDSLSNIRVGLAIYESGDDEDDHDDDYYGARIKEGLADIDTNREVLKSTINSLTASGWTPLAHSFEQLGRYFIQGNNQSLTMHPDSTEPKSKPGYYIFSHQPAYDHESDIPTEENPAIQYACQKNFIVAMTDGRPQKDRLDVDADLEDYDGDCSKEDSSCDDYDQKTTGSYSYESDGSDYLDDVALALFDIDLRPDYADYKNNVRSYMVGFADEQVINDPLLSDTADAGGGEFFTAKDSQELVNAFTRIANELAASAAAASAVSFNSGTLLDTGTAVFQATFESATWNGKLKAIELNSDGSLPTATDPDGETVLVSDWEASEKLGDIAWGDRKIFTYGEVGGVKEGVEFAWNNLTTAQQDDFYRGVDDLDVNGDGDRTDFAGGFKEAADAQLLLDYIKGDKTHEGTAFRQRLTRLGDIVNSSAAYVGKPRLGWPDYSVNNKFGSASNSYSSYKNSTTRRPVVYVGANDGMLHGFDGYLSSDSANAGNEVMAYIPSTAYSSSNNEGLHYLANPYYGHRFYVDATPEVSDVYIQRTTAGFADWRTVLIGGLGSGGRGVYALDVSDPNEFSNPAANAASIVLWEFTNADDTDLGYTFSQPTIVMMPNGKWAAIFGNGYNSDNERSALFIVFLEGGLDGTWTLDTDYIKIYAEQNDGTANGGLSTPRVVDADGDKVADRVYAGDLQGNLWAFDISDADASNWKVAYANGGNKQPLFSANYSGAPQPITSAPIVAKNSNIVTLSDDPDTVAVEGNEPNLLVLFGTGKFLEPTDANSHTDQMSYYGIADTNTGGLNRGNLAVRTIVPTTVTDTATGQSVPARELTGDAIDWSTQKGWYMDLPTAGERVVADSLLRRTVLFFNTLIPNSVPCSFGGSGWLMSLDYTTGLAPDFAVFDANNDGTIDEDDINVVGQLHDTGGLSGPGIVGNEQINSDTGGNLSDREIYFGPGMLEGRLNWSEVLRK